MIEALASEWEDAGVEDGDVLLLHSSIKRTIRRYSNKQSILTPQGILESFLRVLGPSGTLVLPLFNFEFTEGVPFDIRSTPSQMGALTEAGRLHPRAVRTGHPIYSFVAIGREAGRFEGVDNFSGYGSDSPFAILRQLNGKIAVLDIEDQNSMTFYHYVEEMHEVSYRFHKEFSGDYTDSAGKKELRSYGLFVRDIEKGVKTYVAPAGQMMWDAGLYGGYKPHEGCGLRHVGADAMYDFVADIIMSGRAKNILYQTE